ncbi:uncharacterized protein LOC123544970 isoform X2 [Mercenaria mercenaria]|uniref:uncharacterized protein LOC123544970 isoform X2 n=1 Tax=Mercenaria mercenaria TaxID=6596 RepID=UPI00234F182F|nr:uncharacterized protein LOC123544970 isoform X2 [Mercenaria mercenaria]
MSKSGGSKVVEVEAPQSAVNQLMGLYVIVAFLLALSWLLGNMSFSFLWIFGIIFGLFIVWKTRLREILERTLDWHKEYHNRKRALRQEETAEWLNFIINRWWVFSSVSIEDVVRRRINDRLHSVKPTFIGNLELTGFTFGDITPCIRNIKAFECTDGVRGFKPASWSDVTHPPAGLDKMSTFQIVLEADIASRCEDFRMVFRARAGGERIGLSFDTAVEELRIKGRLQIVLHMSMEVPFPHITKATVSFSEEPEVWFNVTVLKALQLMEVPLLKSWIHINVMEGITKALVDPGKIDIHIATVGPVNAQQFVPQNKLAQGVLTLQLKGTPSVNADEDVHYTRLRVGKCKRQSAEVLATQAWEDCCSFFIYDITNEKLNIKHKCKRLLSTVTLEQHDLKLSSFPFNLEKQINDEIENKDGSKLSLMMDYSPLPHINLVEEEPVCVLQRSGVLYVCVHSASNVIAMDKSGSSDPYCVVFCDRRRVLTTPYILQNRNPSWQSQTEFFVRDFSQCQLSFYVFDWDGTNTIDDDFLGSAMYAMSEKEPCVLNKALVLGYNKQDEGHVTDMSLGQIYVSLIFRPVPSVERSERYRLTSTDSMNNNNNEFLYVEDMVSPGTLSIIDHVQRANGNDEQAGSRRRSKYSSLSSHDKDFMKDRVFVDLCILQAKDLIPMDRNGYSDPFCVVKMGDTKLFSTSVKKKSLNPKWNESVTLQVTEDSGKLDIELYDQDLMFNDFLGKISLTLDQLKEISLKGSSDWFQLQHVKSGQLQITCTVTAPDTLKKEAGKSVRSSKEINIVRDQSKASPSRALSSDSDVFITPANTQVTKSAPPESLKNHNQPTRQNNLGVNNNSPNTSTPLKDSPIPTSPLKESPVPPVLRRSASDVNVGRRPSQTNSMNSFAAFQDLDTSGESTVGQSKYHIVSDSSENMNLYSASDSKNNSAVSPSSDIVALSPNGFADRMFNVTGKVMSVQGLKFSEGTIYCKVRVISPNKHRLRQIFGSRVIAKSPMIKATQPTLNLPIDVDRGMGVSGETLLKFDIKREGKEHLATKAFTLRSLFSGPCVKRCLSQNMGARHFVETHFVEQTNGRKDIMPNGHYAECDN